MDILVALGKSVGLVGEAILLFAVFVVLALVITCFFSIFDKRSESLAATFFVSFCIIFLLGSLTLVFYYDKAGMVGNSSRCKSEVADSEDSDSDLADTNDTTKTASVFKDKEQAVNTNKPANVLGESDVAGTVINIDVHDNETVHLHTSDYTE